MRCLITNCSHTRSRQARINIDNSWEKYQICGCCEMELIWFKTLTGRITLGYCKYQLREELKPPEKKPLPKVYKKPKTRYQRTWIKMHGPPMPNDLI